VKEKRPIYLTVKYLLYYKSDKKFEIVYQLHPKETKDAKHQIEVQISGIRIPTTNPIILITTYARCLPLGT